MTALLVEVDTFTHHRAGDKDVGSERRVEDADETLTILTPSAAVGSTYLGEAGAAAFAGCLVVFGPDVFSLQSGEHLCALIACHGGHPRNEFSPPDQQVDA